MRVDALAEQLLQAHLSPKQLLYYTKFRPYIVCRGSVSGAEYEVPLDGDRVRCPSMDIKYCIIARRSGVIPCADVVLAKKLMIETNERKFVATAVPNRMCIFTLLRYGLWRPQQLLVVGFVLAAWALAFYPYLSCLVSHEW